GDGDFVASTLTGELWVSDATTGAFIIEWFAPGGLGAVLAPVAPAGDFVVGTPSNNEASVWDRCGNAVLRPRETCDDGNNAAGDGCAPNCGSEVCPSTPSSTCDNNGSWPPGSHTLVIHDDANPAADTLAWRQRTYTPDLRRS